MRETLDLLGAVNLPERVTTLVYLTDSDVALHGAGHGLDAQSQPERGAGEAARLAEAQQHQRDHDPSFLPQPQQSASLLFETGGLSADVGLFLFVSRRDLPLIPQNKSDLIQCLNLDVCKMRKTYPRTHVGTVGL